MPIDCISNGLFYRVWPSSLMGVDIYVFEVHRKFAIKDSLENDDTAFVLFSQSNYSKIIYRNASQIGRLNIWNRLDEIHKRRPKLTEALHQRVNVAVHGRAHNKIIERQDLLVWIAKKTHEVRGGK